MNKPKLVGTPLSHFTRKIRILLAELGIDFEFVRATSVLATSATGYGENPLLRVPTLVHGGDTVIESDHIARYLVGKYDPSDRFGVRSERVEDLNRLAVVNGIMDNEVTLILAKRGGLTDLAGSAYFAKLAIAIEAGLAWLDDHTDPEAPGFSYGDIALVCMWQHAAHYKIAEQLDRRRRISGRVARFAARPSVASTAPEASLAEAAAAGWKPT
ncbi:MAG: glutathione S-transferase family protein [Myxococcales bacterium]|nr:glutathione S-transferase family protein [Myxococcales bacterium]